MLGLKQTKCIFTFLINPLERWCDMNKETVELIENEDLSFSTKAVDIEFDKVLSTVVLDITELIELVGTLLFENSQLELTFQSHYYPNITNRKNKQNLFAKSLIQDMIKDGLNSKSLWIYSHIRESSIFSRYEVYRMLVGCTVEFKELVLKADYTLEDYLKDLDSGKIEIGVNRVLDGIIDNIDQVYCIWLQQVINKFIGKDTWNIYSSEIPLPVYNTFFMSMALGIKCEEPIFRPYKLYLNKHQDYRILSWMKQNMEGEKNETNIHDSTTEY